MPGSIFVWCIRRDRLKNLKLAAVCLSCLTMTGCSALNFSVEGLINAPKLTSEQSEIHQALIESVGSNITLKYPKNGEYRSAYVIANIDDEPTDEAMVFYEYTSNGSEEDGLRVNILDKDEDGKWYSVKELAGAGTDIDQVIISPMGSNNQTDVFVGYQNLTNDEKTMEIYSYTDGDFKRVALDTYSVLEPLDINNDGYIELITIQRSTNNDTGAVTAKASMLNMKNNEITRGENVDMCDNVTSYVSSKTGMLDSGRRAIFIDGLTADGKLQTEIIYYRYSGLQNPMQLRSEKLLPLCTRPAGYYSEDMDGDGDVEIPSTSPMVGYENAVADEMLYMTTWSVYEDFYDLKTKYTGYYAISDGYFVTFPKRWNSSVTVKKDSDTNELVFYKYTGDINESNEEIMRIAVSSKNDSEDYISDGYELIDSKGQLDYFVKLPLDRREKLIPTIDEIQNNFYIIN